MKVFVAGSRHVSRLSADVRRRLDNIIDKRLPVVVGDANGADKAVQSYLHSKRYDLVEVFCAGDRCRNNLGGWPVRMIQANGKRRDFSFYATKDRAMAEEATYGLMIWDGKSVGTLMNVARLVRQGKTVVVYTVPAKTFTDLKTEADWAAFVSRCTTDLRERIGRESAAEERMTEKWPEQSGTQTPLL
jgi:hypothetical protein